MAGGVIVAVRFQLVYAVAMTDLEGNEFDVN